METTICLKILNNPGQYEKVILIIKKICEFKPKNKKEQTE